MQDQALSDIRVIEYGNCISAPYCGKLLADLGAEVIKVEKPKKGDESRHHGPFPGDAPHIERSGLFLYINTNKIGVTLDPEKPAGRKLFYRLLEKADVFIENNPARQMKGLGLDYETLKEQFPRLIVAAVSPFGRFGPYQNYKAHDINANAAAAVSMAIGKPDREPLNPPLSQSEYLGGVAAAIGIMLALLVRERTDRGQLIDLSTAETMGYVAAMINPNYHIYQIPWKRSGHRASESGGFYPGTILPCKDGYITMWARSGHAWKRFIRAMENPDWSKNPRYSSRVRMGREYPDEVDALLRPWLMAHTTDEIMQICLEFGIPFSEVRTIDKVASCPHLNARDFFITIKRKEVGSLKYPGFPFKLSETPSRINQPAPRLGEHNELIYKERLGLRSEELSDLSRRNVI